MTLDELLATKMNSRDTHYSIQTVREAYELGKKHANKPSWYWSMQGDNVKIYCDDTLIETLNFSGGFPSYTKSQAKGLAMYWCETMSKEK